MSLVGMKRSMQRGFAPFVWAFVAIMIIGIFAGLGLGGFGGGMNGANGRGGSGSFAKIGDQDISQQEFNSALEQGREQLSQMANYGQPATMQSYAGIPDQAYQQILRDIATAKAAELYGVRVSTGEAEEDARKQVDQQVKRLGQGSSADEVERIRQVLYSNINPQVEQRRLLGQRLKDKLNQEARPVEVKVAHVLIKTDKRSDAEARKLAEDVARQAKAGADFAKLAAQYSEDEGSKRQGGVAGWASGQPAPPPAKGAKPTVEPAQSFVPEFTAAALLLQKGQISNPVRSTFGYHVLKAVDVRDFEPKVEPDKPTPPKPGEKKDAAKQAQEAATKLQQKRQQGIDSYKSAAANAIDEGLVSAQSKELEAQVRPQSSWLKGYLLQLKGDTFLPEAIVDYEKALKDNEPAAAIMPQAFAYKLVDLHNRLAKSYEDKKQKDQAEKEYRAAADLLDRYARTDPDLLTQQGEVLQKLGDKTKALASYEKAMERIRRNPTALAKLEDKFKELGRKDLAQQAFAKKTKQQADEAAEAKRRQEEFQKMMAEQMAKMKKDQPKTGAASGGGTAPITITPNGASKPIQIKVGGAKGATPVPANGAKPGEPAKTPDTGKKPETKEAPPAKP